MRMTPPVPNCQAKELVGAVAEEDLAGETVAVAVIDTILPLTLLTPRKTILAVMDQALLLDPNVWVANTGATVQMTSSKRGMVKETKADDGGNTVTMASGMADGAASVIDICGTTCNKQGGV